MAMLQQPPGCVWGHCRSLLTVVDLASQVWHPLPAAVAGVSMLLLCLQQLPRSAAAERGLALGMQAAAVAVLLLLHPLRWAAGLAHPALALLPPACLLRQHLLASPAASAPAPPLGLVTAVALPPLEHPPGRAAGFAHLALALVMPACLLR